MKNTDTSGRFARIDGGLLFHLALVFFWLNGVATLKGAPGDTRWTFQTGAAINSTPAIGVGGLVYIGSGDGKLYAVDGVTGDKKWDFLTGGRVDSDPVVGIDGTVYVASSDAKLYALDGFSGFKKWECPIQCLHLNYYYPYPKIPAPAMGADGTVYLSDTNGNVVALDGATGRQKWVSVSAETNLVTSPALGPDGTLYFIRGSYRGATFGWNIANLYALDGATGRQKWEFPIDDAGNPYPPIIGADGTVYVGSPVSLCARDGTTGDQRWAQLIGGRNWGISAAGGPPVIGVDGTIFVTSLADPGRPGGTAVGYLYALDGATGNQIWTHKMGYPTPFSAAISSDGTIYLRGSDGNFMALDQTTGDLKWSIVLSAGYPAIGRDGTIYVGAQDGKLYALQGASGLAPGSWPKAGGDARNTSSHQHAGAPQLLPLVTNQLAGLQFPFILETVADGAPPLSYTWFFNGAPLPDMANATLSFGSFDATNAGIYRLRVTNNLGRVDSSDVVLSAGAEIDVDVTGPGKVTRSPLGTLQPLGTSIELVAQPDDGQWFLGWTGDLEDTNRVLRFTASRSLHLQAAFSSPPGTLKWTFRPGGEPWPYMSAGNGSPAIGSDGTVFVLCATLRFKRLYALDGRTGAKKWEGAVDDSPDYAVVGDDGTVYALSRMSSLRAFDGATGATQWTAPVCLAIALGTDDTIIGCGGAGLSALNGRVYALDKATGQVKWWFPAGVQAPVSMPLTMGDDGTVHTIFSDRIYAVDPTNANLKWLYQAESGYATSPAIGADGTLFFGAADKLIALKGTDGATKWKSALDGGVSATPSLGPDGTVFVGTTAGTLYGLDPLTGNKLWASPTAGGMGVPPAVSAGGTVYVTCSTNRLLAVDAKTGGTKWEYVSDESLGSAPAIGADGTVYVAKNGTVWAVQGDRGLADSPWPKFQGNAGNTGSHSHSPSGPPRIITQTPSQMAGIGRPFTLEVLTAGIRPQVFAWYFNAARLNDIIGSSLAFASFDPTNAGTYQVRITNALGRVESQEMRITAGVQLAVEIVGPGQVTGLPAASIVPLGTPIELQAQPQDDRRFLGWSGDFQSTNRTLRLPMESSLRLRATFETRPGELLWSLSTVDTGMQEFCPAIGSDGTVYGAGNGHVFALDGMTGIKKWDTAIYANAGFSSPEISFDGTVYISSDDGNLYALDAGTGTILWKFPYFGSWAFSIGVDGTILLGSTTNNVFALDGKSGQLKLEFPTQNPVFGPPVIGFDNTVFAIETGGGVVFSSGFVRLAALDSEMGILKWAFTNDDAVMFPALGADKTVYVSSAAGKIYALESTLGTLKWSCSVGGSFGSSVSIGEDGTVFAASSDGKIYAFNGTSGAKQWESLNGGLDSRTPTVGSDGTVYAIAKDTLCALDGASGTKQWEYVVPPPMGGGLRPLSSPALGAQGILYLWCHGVFYAVQGNSGLAHSSWPKFQGNARNNGNVALPLVAPELIVPPHQMLDELSTLRVTNTVAGVDPATNSLSFALLAAPQGVRLEPATGILSWTPDETQGPGNYQIAVMVSNSVAPFLMLTNQFTVVVNEVNTAPTLTVPPNQVIAPFSTLVVTNVATDADRPANTLTFGLVSGPAGMKLDPHSGVLTWTPTAGPEPSTNVVVVKVTDDGIPSLSDTNRFTVVVPAVNRALTFAPMADQIVNELATLTVTNHVSDANIPASQLSYDVVTAPAGVVLDRASGVLRWTPTEVQGPSTNAISVKVFYNDEPSLSATQSFQVRVNEVNQAPRLTTAIRSLTVYGGQKLVFTNTATDADWPTNALAFLLDSDAPTGAQLDRITGVFRWTAPAVTAPQTDRFKVWVTDNGEPWKSDSGKFTVVTLPAPADLRLRGIQWVAAGVVRITWETSPGTRYQLQSTARLDAPAWVSAGDTITATADTASQANACGTNTQSYFRVLRVAD